MTLGNKIKFARKNKKLTQDELCRGRITRNMLSSIERDKATPSLDTLKYLAQRLEIPVSYLVSDDEDLFFYEKKESIKHIIAAYSAGKYRECISAINRLSSGDDELNYILSECYFELAKSSLLCGSIISAKKYIESFRKFASLTSYNTRYTEARILLYAALAENIQAPLLEFDSAAFEEHLVHDFDFEFYKYVMLDMQYDYSVMQFKLHLNAKKLIHERRYVDALSALQDILDDKSTDGYNAYVMFGVYTDMESCCKQLLDYEGAYKYASKRLSMLEGFKA